VENRTPVIAYGEGTAGGRVEHHDVPALMGRFQRFLFLPYAIEPFGLTVVEAWASGLDLVVDEEKVGAMWWLKERPDDVDRGAEMFWDTVLPRLSAL
jgi:hypothetical protein